MVSVAMGGGGGLSARATFDVTREFEIIFETVNCMQPEYLDHGQYTPSSYPQPYPVHLNLRQAAR